MPVKQSNFFAKKASHIEIELLLNVLHDQLQIFFFFHIIK